MITHIVCFKLKHHLPLQQRQEAAQAFKKAIEALPALIPDVKHVEVGLNINPAEEWDIVLLSRFGSMEQLKAYAKHPAHLQAVSLLSEVKEARACVDYQTP